MKASNARSSGQRGTGVNEVRGKHQTLTASKRVAVAMRSERVNKVRGERKFFTALREAVDNMVPGYEAEESE